MGELVLTAASGLLQAGGAALSSYAASAAQAAAARAIAGALTPPVDGPRVSALALQTSTEGAAIPIVYGRMRLAGQVIWAARFTERVQTRSVDGGKGGPRVRDFRYSLSFAVALCEGPIGGIGRVWANGEPLDTAGLVMRVHAGSEDQAPDPLIEAIEGAGAAPAYRGLAYVVFEDLPLEAFGDRIPNLGFEVLGAGPRSTGPRMEDLIEGVCLIPASGEFAYADIEVLREIEAGHDATENRHTGRAPSDLVAAVDDLEARLPACRSVALVTAWFGDDLRLSHCTLKPGVERREKETRPLIWSCAGLHRGDAHLVSTQNGAPVYGGTPSDETVIAAIRLLKARGYAVTLYPFILMDVAPGNGRPDPHGGPEQAAFPWRGRITCHPAPGRAESPDKTAAADAQAAAFFGAAWASDFTVGTDEVGFSGGEDWGFSRFILHHAALAAAAGGVEAFVIGSEMRGLTQVRSAPSVYPAVTRLKALAGEARALLGPAVKLSYAADWSEYFGHAPADGSGDRLFHLDPLWADDEIDFIGLDWYAPLSDWRDGEAHADRLAGAASIHDPAYLSANVEGGEGYDWYYADAADRDAQLRTPITDGAYGEAWVHRYKDLRGWWANAHHDRIAGVRQAEATAWVPESKPIRLVELGCPAVDKGANQPNVFIDPKSSESFAPNFSTGARDDLIQRRYVEALLSYWAPDAGRNPQSAVYGGPMIDLAHSCVWTWDARPFPEFPARADVWSDAANWRRGHWLTGRAGQSELAAVIADIAARAGLDGLAVDGVEGLLAGFVIDQPARARDVLAGLGLVFGFDIADRADGPAALSSRPRAAPAALFLERLAQRADGRVSLSRAPAAERAREARLTVIADDGDYRPAEVSARGLDAAENAVISAGLDALADRDLAAGWARGVLTRARLSGERADLTLPPSCAFLEPGDAVTFDAGPPGWVWRIAALDGLGARRADLTPALAGPATLAGPAPGAGEPRAAPSRPLVHAMDLPLGEGEQARGGLLVAGFATPWPGSVELSLGADTASATRRARLDAPAVLGALDAPLRAGVEGRWDRAGALIVRLRSGALSGVTALEALAGRRLAALEGPDGWEVLAFQSAHLRPDGAYEFTGLLRGLGGSPLSTKPEGAAFVLLDSAVARLPVGEEERGADLICLAGPPGAASNDPALRRLNLRYEAVELRPLAPVHLRVRPRGGALDITWIRRGRLAADGWAATEIPLGEAREAYQVTLVAADAVLQVRAVTQPGLTLTAAEIAALFPGGLAAGAVRVAQLSDAYGPGVAAEAAFGPALAP